jgi:hypothetical protein
MALVRPIAGAGALLTSLLVATAAPTAAAAQPAGPDTTLPAVGTAPGAAATATTLAAQSDDDLDDDQDDDGFERDLWEDDPPDPDHERGEVFLELSPSTVQAGHKVAIRAGCGDDKKPAKVRSRAFDDLELIRQDGTKLFTGTTTVPNDTRPGDYRVRLRCDNGAGASAKLHVLNMARPERGPDTGGGGTAAADADTRSGPPGLLTAGLVAAGIGAVLFGYRRARQ